jgi:hypothetical protein
MVRTERRFFKSLKDMDDDPLSGMANLFDLAMVFAVALMVAMVVNFQMTEFLTDDEFTVVKNPGKSDMEIIVKKGKKIERYKGTESSGEGKGKKIGIAYELENGDIIYVPE